MPAWWDEQDRRITARPPRGWDWQPSDTTLAALVGLLVGLIVATIVLSIWPLA